MLGDCAKLKAHIMSLGGFCEYEIDDEDYFRYFFFATAYQMNLTTRFLDVVDFDGTYQTNNENLYLYQVVVLDMNLMAISVFIAFISRENLLFCRNSCRSSDVQLTIKNWLVLSQITYL
ncbi:unnamed protein product [Schistosoma curassoni]|uniref:Ion_trans domain-containing protein n=1 Tax=Schistosoma curassoni TaxID=6186 RepID=A0A183KTN3_9TREM|nr:unnamed protein product [Schistosoma curassoni]